MGLPALEGYSFGRSKHCSGSESASPSSPPESRLVHKVDQASVRPCQPPGPPPGDGRAGFGMRPRPPPGPPPGWRPGTGSAKAEAAPPALCGLLCPDGVSGSTKASSRAQGAIESVVGYAVSYANQLEAPREGPRRALDNVAGMSPPERRRFITRARLDATFSQCPRSIKSWASAVRWWLRYSKCVLARELPFPITAEDLQVASTLFRVGGTFANYCGHWRTASELLSVSTAAFDDRSVKRARMGISKRCPPAPKTKRYVQHGLLAKIVAESRNEEATAAVARSVAMLMCFGYSFLLRLPSEGLPAFFDGAAFNESHHASVCLTAEAIGLRLKRRKNSERPVTIWRKCWCHSLAGKHTCPVHVLGRFFADAGIGVKAFAGFSPAGALSAIRSAVGAVGVDRPGEFDTRSLRRGHALDLVESGANLAQILSAGGWRSAAFIAYLPVEELEREAVLEARDDCSSQSE